MASDSESAISASEIVTFKAETVKLDEIAIEVTEWQD